MLRDATTNGIRKIYIACGFTDLRKGIDGLSLLIQEDFKLNPHNPSVRKAEPPSDCCNHEGFEL